MTSSGDSFGAATATTATATVVDGAARQRVDAALGALQSVSERPLGEHAAAYEHLHEELQAVLAEIDGA